MDFNSLDRLYTLFQQSSGVTTDSRKITPEAMFIALKGENFDGNNFAQSALDQGARVVVVNGESDFAREYLSRGDSSDRVFIVEDTLEALQALARFHRSHFNIPVIALTGTNGKTTTKELLSAVLSKKYNVTFTQGNLNNHIGVPLTLLRITEETEAAVVEMGANHPGEIALLMSIALPNFGLVTNVGKAHLEGFGSFEGVMAAKGEMYDYLQRTADKVFYNCDDEYISAMVSSRPDLTGYRYGIQYNSAEILPVSQQEPYLRLKFSIEGEQKEISSKLVGSYNANNILAAVTVGVYFGVALSDCVAAIEEYTPSNHRSQLENTGRNFLILDTYNANPSSMKASLENFSKSQFLNKQIILGDMLELGADSVAEHSKVIALLGQIEFEKCHLVGGEFAKAAALSTLPENILLFNDVYTLKEYFAAHPVEGKTILVKGSNGIKLPLIKEAL
ncbi:MAG: UDP-N-acetylmuramoyl-tripeptide--D-alanyl-D-alanine ligase [Bacteroidales bacterium]|nr:UDP-N-acetylmuramoyl-tripeptide--D-alanyl-D-alanine ligase [Bacteroidales bacterium]